MTTTILIVEDEESLADPLAYLLQKEGFEALVAADAVSYTHLEPTRPY